MYLKLIYNDMLKNKVFTCIIFLFITLSALLISLGTLLYGHLTGAIDTLMTTSKTPHFMQMHAGDIDYPRLNGFAEGNSSVEDFQVIEFLGVNDLITINGEVVTDTVQDIGLTTQSSHFDYLLDLDGKIIQVARGEIYVPVCYMKDQTIKIGDSIAMGNKIFTVAGFLRDSQMNALLASSKRFLINDLDYDEVKQLGKVEYLIEFRLKDVEMLSTFTNDYTMAGLEANGPTVTYPLFKMLNGISDGILGAILLLISLLVIAIALMCIRLTLLAKIEEDYREIGVMKAIGLRISDLKKIYLAQYVGISSVATLAGLALAWACKDFVLTNIRLYMGESNQTIKPVVLGLLGILGVLLIILVYVNAVLNCFKKLSITQAIHFDAGEEKAFTKSYFKLSGPINLHPSILLGLKDVLIRKKLYSTLFIIFILASFILLVPQNLYHTLSSKDFSKYMGIGTCDIRIDIQTTDHVQDKELVVAESVSKDQTVSRFTTLTTKVFPMMVGDGTLTQLKVELGDHTVFPVHYAEGHLPKEADELALSTLMANELGKKVGDSLTLVINNQPKTFKLCGIYSDITNGGKTAKAAFEDMYSPAMWSVLCIELKNEEVLKDKVDTYEALYSFAKVTSIDTYVSQTFGTIISTVRIASYGALLICVVLTFLITILFLRMLVAKDRHTIAILKSIGFTSREIDRSYSISAIVVLTMGIAVGTLLANTLGEYLASSLIGLFGASTFQFTINPLTAYVLCPLMLILTVKIATILGVTNIRKVKLSENIKE